MEDETVNIEKLDLENAKKCNDQALRGLDGPSNVAAIFSLLGSRLKSGKSSVVSMIISVAQEVGQIYPDAVRPVAADFCLTVFEHISFLAPDETIKFLKIYVEWQRLFFRGAAVGESLIPPFLHYVSSILRNIKDVDSMRIAAECPFLVLLLFQSHRKWMSENLFPTLDVLVNFASMSPTKVTMIVHVKILSLLAFIARGAPGLLRNLPAGFFIELLVRVCRGTSADAPALRKEIVLAFRHLLTTDFRISFGPYLNTLLSIDFFLGGGSLSTFFVLKQLVVVTLADLVYHFRLDLSFETVFETVLPLFSESLLEDARCFPTSESVGLSGSSSVSTRIVATKLLCNLAEAATHPQLSWTKNEKRQVVWTVFGHFCAVFSSLCENVKELESDTELKTFVRAVISGIKVTLFALRSISASSPLVSSNSTSPCFSLRDLTIEEGAIFVELFRDALMVLDRLVPFKGILQSVSSTVFQESGFKYPILPTLLIPEDKELLEQFAFIFAIVDVPIFLDVFGASMPLVWEKTLQNPYLLTIPLYLVSLADVSRQFCGTLLRFLMKSKSGGAISQLYNIGIYEASVLQRYFKMVFGAIASFPDEIEPVFQPFIGEFIMSCFRLSGKASEPVHCFLLLKSLFRSIGGGRFELLYKEVLPLLPVILETLNTLLSLVASAIGESSINSTLLPLRELFVELLLTVPVRLSVLLPYLSFLMRPLVFSLSSTSPELVGQGLRTLELCIDNLTQDFLEPILGVVLRDLLEGLWTHCRPLPYPSQYSHTALRILGKLAGKNRRAIKPLKFSWKEPIIGSFKIYLGKEGQIITADLGELFERLHVLWTDGLKRSAFNRWTLLETITLSIFKEGLKEPTLFGNRLWQLLIESLFFAAVLGHEACIKTLGEVFNQNTLIPIEAMNLALRCIADNERSELRDIACDILTRSDSNSSVVGPVLSALLFDGGVFGRLSACEVIIKLDGHLPEDSNDPDYFLSGLLWVLSREGDSGAGFDEVSVTNPCGAIGTRCDEAIDALLNCGAENSLVVIAIDEALFSWCERVRLAGQRVITAVSNRNGTSPTVVLRPYAVHLATRLMVSLRSLTLPLQIANLDCWAYLLGIDVSLAGRGEDGISEDLVRFLSEAIAMADTDDQNVPARSGGRIGGLQLVRLRVASIRLLSAAMASEEFLASKYLTLRNRIVSVFFKNLYARNMDIVAVSKRGLGQVIAMQHKLPKELMNHGLRPVLVNLSDYKRLTVPGLEGLGRLLELLTSYFKVEIGRKLLEHLRQWADPSVLGMAANHVSETSEIRIIVAILDVFHFLPQTSNVFVEETLNMLVALDTATRRTVSSVFRRPVIKYIAKYIDDMICVFFSKRLGDCGFLRLFSELIIDPVFVKDATIVAAFSYLEGFNNPNTFCFLLETYVLLGKAILNIIKIEEKNEMDFDIMLLVMNVAKGFQILFPASEVEFWRFQVIRGVKCRIGNGKKSLASTAACVIADCIEMNGKLSSEIEFGVLLLKLTGFGGNIRSEAFEGFFCEALVPFSRMVVEDMINRSNLVLGGCPYSVKIHFDILDKYSEHIERWNELLSTAFGVIQRKCWETTGSQHHECLQYVADVLLLLLNKKPSRFSIEVIDTGDSVLQGLIFALAVESGVSIDYREAVRVLAMASGQEAPVCVRGSCSEALSIALPRFLSGGNSTIALTTLLEDFSSFLGFSSCIWKAFVDSGDYSQVDPLVVIEAISNVPTGLGLSLVFAAAKILGVVEETNSRGRRRRIKPVTSRKAEILGIEAAVRLYLSLGDTEKESVEALRAIRCFSGVAPFPWHLISKFGSEVSLQDNFASTAAAIRLVIDYVDDDKNRFSEMIEGIPVIFGRLFLMGHPLYPPLVAPLILGVLKHTPLLLSNLFPPSIIEEGLDRRDNGSSGLVVLLELCLCGNHMTGEYPDLWLLLVVRIFEVVAREHTGISGTFVVTRDVRHAAAIILICLSIIENVSERLQALPDAKSLVLGTFLHLFDPSSKCSSFILVVLSHIVRRWILESETSFLVSLREKMDLVFLVLGHRDKFEIIESDIQLYEYIPIDSRARQYLGLEFSVSDFVCGIYACGKYVNSELVVRLEKHFLILMLSNPTLNLTKIDCNSLLGVFDSLLPESLFLRMRYLFGIQSWEAVSGHFWIHSVLQLLLVTGKEMIKNYESEKISKSDLNHMELAFLLATIDDEYARCLWVRLFPQVWNNFSMEQKTTLCSDFAFSLSRSYHHGKAGSGSVALALLDGFRAIGMNSKPIPPGLVRYIAKNFCVWYSAMLYLEDTDGFESVDDWMPDGVNFNSDSSLSACLPRDSLADLYASLGEWDLFYGRWRQRAVFSETVIALSLEQSGMLESAQIFYELVQSKARAGLLSYSISRSDTDASCMEFSLWQERWISAARKLQQWDVLVELAKVDNDIDLSLEGSWRLLDWACPKDQQALRAALDLVADAPTPKRKLYEALLALHQLSRGGVEKKALDKFGRAVEEGFQVCLAQWQVLPRRQLAMEHHSLLHLFQLFVEIHEAVGLFAASTGGSLVEVKGMLATWRERLPSVIDNVTLWSDLVAWRQQVFTALNDMAESGTGESESLAGLTFRGYHETAWLTNRFARVARKHGLSDTAISLLNRIYTLPNIEIQDAFSKLREQAKCYMQKSSTGLSSPWMPKECAAAGLDLVNATNLGYFGTTQKADFFSLKARFLERLEWMEEANKVHGQAVQLDLGLGKAWAAWGDFNRTTLGESAQSTSSLHAVHCCLQALSSLAPGKATLTLVSHILVMLARDDASGIITRAFEAFEETSSSVLWSFVPFVPYLVDASFRPKEARGARSLLMKLAKVHPYCVLNLPEDLYSDIRQIIRTNHPFALTSYETFITALSTGRPRVTWCGELVVVPGQLSARVFGPNEVRRIEGFGAQVRETKIENWWKKKSRQIEIYTVEGQRLVLTIENNEKQREVSKSFGGTRAAQLLAFFSRRLRSDPLIRGRGDLFDFTESLFPLMTFESHDCLAMTVSSEYSDHDGGFMLDTVARIPPEISFISGGENLVNKLDNYLSIASIIPSNVLSEYVKTRIESAEDYWLFRKGILLQYSCLILAWFVLGEEPATLGSLRIAGKNGILGHRGDMIEGGLGNSVPFRLGYALQEYFTPAGIEGILVPCIHDLAKRLYVDGDEIQDFISLYALSIYVSGKTMNSEDLDDEEFTNVWATTKKIQSRISQLACITNEERLAGEINRYVTAVLSNGHVGFSAGGEMAGVNAMDVVVNDGIFPSVEEGAERIAPLFQSILTLIAAATSPQNLCQMDPKWNPWF